MDTSFIKNLLSNISNVMTENRDYLIDLDSIVGDGDLGLTMSDGFAAASAVANESDETSIGKLLFKTGKAMASAVPSTMGTLMASGLMAAGKALKEDDNIGPEGLVTLFRAYADGVASRGGAKQGEKTFLDGLIPAVNSIEADVKINLSLKDVAANAKAAAADGYESTQEMLAKHGRAAIHGEKSRELKDPGAKVAELIMEGFVRSVYE